MYSGCQGEKCGRDILIILLLHREDEAVVVIVVIIVGGFGGAAIGGCGCDWIRNCSNTHIYLHAHTHCLLVYVERCLGPDDNSKGHCEPLL